MCIRDRGVVVDGCWRGHFDPCGFLGQPVDDSKSPSVRPVLAFCGSAVGAKDDDSPVPQFRECLDVIDLATFELEPVSYTHLDVYKRQAWRSMREKA